MPTGYYPSLYNVSSLWALKKRKERSEDVVTLQGEIHEGDDLRWASWQPFHTTLGIQTIPAGRCMVPKKKGVTHSAVRSGCQFCGMRIWIYFRQPNKVCLKLSQCSISLHFHQRHFYCLHLSNLPYVIFSNIKVLGWSPYKTCDLELQVVTSSENQNGIGGQARLKHLLADFENISVNLPQVMGTKNDMKKNAFHTSYKPSNCVFIHSDSALTHLIFSQLLPWRVALHWDLRNLPRPRLATLGGANLVVARGVGVSVGVLSSFPSVSPSFFLGVL